MLKLVLYLSLAFSVNCANARGLPLPVADEASYTELFSDFLDMYQDNRASSYDVEYIISTLDRLNCQTRNRILSDIVDHYETDEDYRKLIIDHINSVDCYNTEKE